MAGAVIRAGTFIRINMVVGGLVFSDAQNFFCRPTTVELWAVNHSESPADKLLIELSGQGIIVTELADYLDQLKIETYHLGLRKFGKSSLFPFSIQQSPL